MFILASLAVVIISVAVLSVLGDLVYELGHLNHDFAYTGMDTKSEAISSEAFKQPTYYMSEDNTPTSGVEKLDKEYEG